MNTRAHRLRTEYDIDNSFLLICKCPSFTRHSDRQPGLMTTQNSLTVLTLLYPKY